MADLKTNYVDDVLDTTKNQLRKYQQIQNDDGTVSFVDVTEYTQVGTSFGAKDINDTNAAINDVNGKLTKAFPTDNAIHSLDDKIRISVYSGGLALQLSIDESKDYYVMLSFDQSGFAYIRNDSNGYVSKRIV